METCIIVTGNPVDGSEYVGPFPNATEAAEYADQFIGCDYWIASIDPPAMETRASIERKTAAGEWDTEVMAARFKKMAEAILDDADGISERGYAALYEFAGLISSHCAGDLSLQVDSADGRFYIPSGK